MKVLVVDSSEKYNIILRDLFSELEGKGFSFYYLCSKKNTLDELNRDNKNVKKVFLASSAFTRNKILFLLFMPYIFIRQLIIVARLKKIKKIKVIISVNLNEKIIFSLIARVLKLKNIWIEFPGVDYKNRCGIYKRLYKRFSEYSVIVTFLSLTKSRLKACLLGRDNERKNIKTIPIGIKMGKFKRQENIFSSIAKGERSSFSKKYFTIGTVLNVSQTSSVEILFLAAKFSMDFIPNLQIIIVDEDSQENSLVNKKKITWLAKKMGIESLVWYVQESSYLNKWLDSFDVFIVSNDIPSIENLRVIVNAMASSLPILAPRNCGFEDLVCDAKNGFLLEKGNNVALAEQVISLYKDRRLMNSMGNECVDRVKEKYQLEYMVSRFEKIINN